MNIDFIRTSASRPELLEISTESIKERFKYSGKIRYILHEDCLNSAASKQVIDYAGGFYDIIKSDNPPIGHMKSFIWLYEQTTTDYVIHWEDDYELIKELDMDSLIDIMNKYPNEINQLVFSKRDILPDKPGFPKIEKIYDGITITTCQHWMMLPAICRSSFIKPKIEMLKLYRGRDFHWELNRFLKGRDNNHDAQWVINNTKTFYVGKLRAGKTVEHIGKHDKSVREGKYKW